MSLSQQQQEFTRLLGQLIAYAYSHGYALTLGEAWRPPETAALYASQGKGIKNSLHIQRLAVDINLFKLVNGQMALCATSEEHRPLGIYWKSLNPNCRWGGDFISHPDGNHYSYTPDGIRA